MYVYTDLQGPFVNSEYYSGWLTHWDERFQTVQTQNFTRTLATMLSLNASVNIYMFYGGTNFGFSAGIKYCHYFLSSFFYLKINFLTHQELMAVINIGHR